VILIVKRIKII